MPSIRVTDGLGVEILSVDAGPESGFLKYFRNRVAGFVASAEFVQAARNPITDVSSASFGSALRFSTEGGFGSSDTEWEIGGQAPLTVAVTQPGEQVPGDELPFSPMVVTGAKAVVSYSFSPTLSAAVGRDTAALQFGFEAGSDLVFRAGRAYDLRQNPPTLAGALQDLLATGTLPVTVDDLRHMDEGDFGSVLGSGAITVAGAFDIARILNPLASPSLDLHQLGSLQVEAGPSLEVGATIAVRGMYQVRVQKAAAQTVRLAFYKAASSHFQFDVTASVGAEAVLDDETELVKSLLGMVGAPSVDAEALAAGGLRPNQIEDMQTAIQGSLDRSIAISLMASFATAKEDSRLFEYVFELDRLGADGTEALQRAMRADLTALTLRTADSLPAGVRLVHSELEQVRSRRITWKINVFGLVNLLHMRELIHSGKTLFSEETGELVIADSLTAKSLTAVSRPLAADARKFQKLLLQSLVMTAAVRASGLQKSLGLNGTMSYFEQVAVARQQNISDFLDNFTGALLITAEEKQEFLKSSFHGHASVFLDLTLNDRDVQALFFDASGAAHAVQHYETIARMCMERLVQPGDENDFRRAPVLPTSEGEELWRRMRRAGPAALGTVLPNHLKQAGRLEILRRDYIVMSWWADAMSRAARPVAEMREFLRSSTDLPERLEKNEEFLRRRDKLTGVLRDIVRATLPDFVDAWGLLAMYTAARRLAAIRGVLLTDSGVLVRAREGAAQHA